MNMQDTNKVNVRTWVVLVLILIAAFSRLISPYNFSPLVAIALFGGSHFQKRWQAYFVPLGAYFLSDLAFYVMGKVGFYGLSQIFVYSAMMLVTALGTTLHNPKTVKVLGYALSGSAIFWIVSNFGVWVGSQVPGAIEYEPGLTLSMTYVRALPFFNDFSKSLFLNAFAGNLLYTFLLFGVFALVRKNYPTLQYSNL